jgi:DNA polymerase-3 subunit alpha
MISDVRKITTKKGDKMAFVTLVDLDEMIDVTLFPDVMDEHKSLLSVGRIVEISGKKSAFGGKQNAIEADKIELK